MRTPGSTIAPPPIHTSSPIVIGRPISTSRRSSGSIGCVAVYSCTLGARKTLFPMRISATSSMQHPVLAWKCRPTWMCAPTSPASTRPAAVQQGVGGKPARRRDGPSSCTQQRTCTARARAHKRRAPRPASRRRPSREDREGFRRAAARRAAARYARRRSCAPRASQPSRSARGCRTARPRASFAPPRSARGRRGGVGDADARSRDTASARTPRLPARRRPRRAARAQRLAPNRASTFVSTN